MPRKRAPAATSGAGRNFVPVGCGGGVVGLSLGETKRLTRGNVGLRTVSGRVRALERLTRDGGRDVSSCLGSLGRGRGDGELSSLVRGYNTSGRLLGRILGLSRGGRERVGKFSRLARFFPRVGDLRSLPRDIIRGMGLGNEALLSRFLHCQVSRRGTMERGGVAREETRRDSIKSRLGGMGKRGPRTTRFLGKL